MDMTQILLIAQKYMREHPAELNRAAGANMFSAFLTAFPLDTTDFSRKPPLISGGVGVTGLRLRDQATVQRFPLRRRRSGKGLIPVQSWHPRRDQITVQFSL